MATFSPVQLAEDAVDYGPPCGQCGEPMRLDAGGGAFGPGYYCARCRLRHAAKADGSPCGIPGDRATHAARRRAHEVFDAMWQGPDPLVTRDGAYRWLATILRLPAEQAHIGRLDVAQCERVVAEFSRLVPQLRQTKSEQRAMRERRDANARARSLRSKRSNGGRAPRW